MKDRSRISSTEEGSHLSVGVREERTVVLLIAKDLSFFVAQKITRLSIYD